MFFAWQQAGFKPAKIEIQPTQEIEDGWKLEASEEAEREASAILLQDTVNFIAELAVARDNQSTILSGSPRENSEELPIQIQQVSDNTVGETTEQHTSFWPKVLPLVSVLPIDLTVAHWHHFSPILASIWLKSVAHWSHCCSLVTVVHWSHPLY